MTNEPKGQILPSSTFGRLLTAWAYQSETIVEIGTWHGQGSTRCLYNGLIRSHQRLVTIEQDEACYKEAKASYSDPRITFIHNRTLNVINQLPLKIDLLLSDGDEDSDAEFDALQARCVVIALDDCNDKKNKRQRQLLLDWNWEVIADCLTERHGWAMFKRLG